MDEELDYDNGPGSVAFERKLRASEHEFNKNKPCVVYFRAKPSDKPIKSAKDIVVGQFYRAEGADGYYYVGIQHGDKKRLACINMTQNEIDNEPDEFKDDVFCPSGKWFLKEWKMVECTQEEAMRAK